MFCMLACICMHKHVVLLLLAYSRRLCNIVSEVNGNMAIFNASFSPLPLFLFNSPDLAMAEVEKKI